MQPDDLAMGSGPFARHVDRWISDFTIYGPQPISSVGEMCIRDVYLRDDWLLITDGDTVLDLEANMGNFTDVALSIGPDVRAISVKASNGMNSAFLRSVALASGYWRKVRLTTAFLGNAGEKRISAIAENSNNCHAEWFTEEELASRTTITKNHVQEGDIKGSECGLLTLTSRLLSVTKSPAVETDSLSGDAQRFSNNVESRGLRIGAPQHDPDGKVIFLAKGA